MSEESQYYSRSAKSVKSNTVLKHRLINRKELINLSAYPLIHFKRAAFTLAEVLITIGVIGVVAALTIPTLIDNYHKKQYYSQFMKARSIIENAKKMYDDEDGSYLIDDFISISPLIEFLPKYTKGELIDNYSEIKGYDIKSLNGNIDLENLFEPCNRSMFETIDGINYISCPANFDEYTIIVDVNGYKNPPNSYGRDIFLANYNEFTNKLDWYGVNGEWKDSCSNPKEDGGYNCAGRLLEKGKMDY